MKQTQAFISTYTADVSGVCSALFELGGMTVMHDASGCNSTYNTHDEPRWYDHDSLVFISGLSEMEALMGDDDKLIRDIVSAARDLSPEFIALAGTPIPMMTGCDIPAIAREIRQMTGIPCFGLQTNGMHSYVAGAGAALAAYARNMADPTVKMASGAILNILGATPLDFSVNGTVESMVRFLSESGWTVNSTWAMGSRPEELKRAGAARVNLVVSSVGLETARVLKERFGTPYVLGTPYKGLGPHILDLLETSATDLKDRTAFRSFCPAADTPRFIIGESITARSLAAAVSRTTGKQYRVLCPLEATAGTLSSSDLALDEEEDMVACLRQAEEVIADPLFRPIVPDTCRFTELPHEACSGRIFRSVIPNLVESTLIL